MHVFVFIGGPALQARLEDLIPKPDRALATPADFDEWLEWVARARGWIEGWVECAPPLLGGTDGHLPWGKN